MNRIGIVLLIAVVAFAPLYFSSHERSIGTTRVYHMAPFQDLIINPMRYRDQGVKTVGFVLRTDEGHYFLVSQRDRGMIFDLMSRILLDGNQIERGQLVPELSGHIVYVEGLFVVEGREGDLPGAMSRKILITEIFSPEIPLEDAESKWRAEKEGG